MHGIAGEQPRQRHAEFLGDGWVIFGPGDLAVEKPLHVLTGKAADPRQVGGRPIASHQCRSDAGGGRVWIEPTGHGGDYPRCTQIAT